MKYIDNVYGEFEIDNKIQQIIDTAEFKRLKNIKQLGMSSYIFNTGNHTRYEHCIGVMHLSGLFLNHAVKNSEKSLGKKILTDSELEHFTFLIKCAGLFHDIGHGPKSHIFEQALKTYTKKEVFNHEKMSIQLAKKIYSRMNFYKEEDLALIISIMKGNPSKKYKKYTFLFEIINNKINGFDTDKMDYLLRDYYYIKDFNSETKDDMELFNIDDLETILYNSYIKEYENKYELYYDSIIYHTIRKVYQTRIYMFSNYYFNRYVIQIDKLVLCCIYKNIHLFINKDKFISTDDFLKYDDSLIESLLLQDENYYGEIKKIVFNKLLGIETNSCHENCITCQTINLNREIKKSRETGNKDPLNFIKFD